MKPTYQQLCASMVIDSVESLIQGNREFSSDIILSALEYFRERANTRPDDPSERKLILAVIAYLEDNL